jgi:hypothetical protein
METLALFMRFSEHYTAATTRRSTAAAWTTILAGKRSSDKWMSLSPTDRSKTAENKGFLLITGVSEACGCAECRLTAKRELSSIISIT